MEKSVENIDFVESIKKHFELSDIDANLYSPLVLAYIGDAIYEVIVRTMIISKGNMPVNKLHRASSELVKAGTQAKVYELIKDELTDEEISVLKRGRNAKSHTVAKNASVNEYRKATGVEALVGYLYIIGNYDRLNYLVKLGLDRLMENEK